MVDVIFQSQEEIGRDPLHHFQTVIQDQITKAEKHTKQKIIMSTSNPEACLSGSKCDTYKKIVDSLLQSDKGKHASGLGFRYPAS